MAVTWHSEIPVTPGVYRRSGSCLPDDVKPIKADMGNGSTLKVMGGKTYRYDAENAQWIEEQNGGGVDDLVDVSKEAM